MIFLTRTTFDDHGGALIEIAACEDATRAVPYLANGYERCSPAAFRAAWQARDARALEELGEDVQAALVERSREAGVPVDLVGHWR